MHEPSARASRIAIAAGVAAFIIAGGGGFLLGRASAPQIVSPAPVSPPVPPPVPLSPPEPPRIWGRAEMLELADRATDAFASGKALPEEMAATVGQRFDFVIPFGCDGPSPGDSDATMRWRYDEEEGVLRLHVMPDTWQGADWGLPDEGEPHGARGFWVPRPWSSSDDCPARDKAAQSPSPPSQTLALAQFQQGGEKDFWRTERPLQKTVRMAPEDFDASRGFRLRLIGRIDQVPGNGPVHCRQPLGSGQRPECVLAMALHEIRLEDGAGGPPLAIWEDRSIIGSAQVN